MAMVPRATPRRMPRTPAVTGMAKIHSRAAGSNGDRAALKGNWVISTMRLVISRMSHPAVSCLYGGLALIGVLLALLIRVQPAAGLIAPFIIAACSALLYLLVHKQEAKRPAVER